MSGVGVTAEQRRPNILLIYADDLGYEAHNCYGGLDFETPNIDRMAREGIRFSRAYTSGVCTPSRVSLHTGLYTTHHGHTDVLPVHEGTAEIVDYTKMPAFAQLLRADGYRTALAGKWQMATLEIHPDHPRVSGFDSWCLWQIWKTDPETGVSKKTTRYWNPSFNEDGKLRKDIRDRFGPDVMMEYVGRKMAEAADANEPFLIVYNELLPHAPVIQTPDDLAANPPRPAELGNMINYLDKLVERLLDKVDELGIRENTYVLFMGDNGTSERNFKNPLAGQPGEKAHTRHTTAGRVNGGKFTMTDGGTHVPLIVWGPKSIPQSAVCDDLVDIVDLFPTFCDLAGTDIPENILLDGRSIVPQIHGRPGPKRDFVHGSVLESSAVFDGQWRLYKDGTLIDARNLPEEVVTDPDDPEAQKARARLEAVFELVSKNEQVELRENE